MKNIIPFIAPIAFFFYACSDESESTNEPDIVSPTIQFSIAGIGDNLSLSQIPVLSKQIEINIDAKDEGGISKIEAFINDVKEGEDVSPPYQIIIDISSYTSKVASTKKYKEYILKVVATDNSGNSSYIEQQIYIDNELPSISEVSLGENAVINGNANTLTFVVSDNTGISSVMVSINDRLIATIENGDYTLNLDTTELIYGLNTLKIEAKDTAENIGKYVMNFITDNMGPEINLESVIANQILDELMSLNPQVSDTYSTINSVEILLNDTSLAIFDETASSYQFNFDCTKYPTGTNNLVFIAKDYLGNESRKEIPIEIYRRLITINFPSNYYDPELARIYVFASSFDGKLLDTKRVVPDSQQIILRTKSDVEVDSEFTLTFAEYRSDMYGNGTSLTTLQNLKRSTLSTINLKVAPRFQYQSNQQMTFPAVGFDPLDHIQTFGQGFGYSGGLNTAEKNVFSTDRRINTASEINTDLMYIPIINYTMNEYHYFILDWNLPSDFVLDKNQARQDDIERRIFQTSKGSGDYISNINIYGYFNENDFQNNVYHFVSGAAFGYLPLQGGTYFYNTNLYKTRYEFAMPGYHTSRIGEPLSLFQDLNWTVDYSIQGKEINIDKTGTGHYVGKIYIGSDSPQLINGLNVSYAWNLIFNSETTDKVILPELPEEMQTWGFNDFYKNNDLRIWQVEIKKYEGIKSYNEYLNKVIKNNDFFHKITPVMESKFKNDNSPGYYFRGSNFLLD